MNYIDKDKKIAELAEFMHDEYENAARQYGWITQETTRCDFENLPEANKKTMLLVALRVYKTLQEQHKKEYEDGIKKAVDYISFNEGWEETGDKYRKHFGLKEKFNKLKYEK